MESRLRDMAVRLEKYLWERSNSGRSVTVSEDACGDGAPGGGS